MKSLLVVGMIITLIGSLPAPQIKGAAIVLSTTSFVLEQQPTLASMGGYPVIQISYLNNASSFVLSVFIWAAVMNPSGQTLGVFIGSDTFNPDQIVTVNVPIFNLPSGNYMATLFPTTISGIVLGPATSTGILSL